MHREPAAPFRVTDRPLVVTLVLVAVALTGACSTSSDVIDSTTGEDTAGVVLGAILGPVIPVDVSGEIVLVDAPGFSDDRLDVEIEIDADGFGTLAIDDGDGFDDERVTLFRGVGTELAVTDLAFTEDRRVQGVGDVVFEATVTGDTVPAIQEGDSLWIRVNGTLALEGLVLRR